MESEDKEYPPPIRVVCEAGHVRISYDQVNVDFPERGSGPADAPPMARRIFRALKEDLRRNLRAE